MHRTLVAAAVLLILFSCWPVLLQAQATNATVTGFVTDPTKAVIVGAKVDVINMDTNIRYTATTNQEGIYTVPNLPSGSYRIEVGKPGFKTVVKSDVVLHVQDTAAINFEMALGSASEIVTVQAGGVVINTTDASVGTVIDRDFVGNLPLNGRSFNTLLQLTPGVVIGESGQGQGQFNIAGQRTDANNFLVDGVSANFGGRWGVQPLQSGTGSAQALSATGGTSSLVSVDALEEFRVETSSFAPELGRSPGGQVMITTRSGANSFHGTAFEYFRNNVLDANDWFANQAGNLRAPERHNDFGGTIGGPILKDRTFFFFSYEGARLRLPQTETVRTPSMDARMSAPPQLAQYLNGYPMPNGPISSGDIGEFTGTFSNSASLNATSLRIDHSFNDRFSIFGRYNYAPSQFTERVNTLNNLFATPVNTQTLTVGMNMILNNSISNTVRGNYSTQFTSGIFSLDSFGGASPPSPSLVLGPLPSDANQWSFGTFDAGSYESGPHAKDKTTQFNFVDNLSVVAGSHQLKFGTDYRRILLDVDPVENAVGLLSPSVQEFISTGTARFIGDAFAASRILTQAFSLYGQDTWKATPRLAITYGLRWELSPAPSGQGATKLASWENTGNPAEIALAPFGTPIWKTTYGNFAPRLGIAYKLSGKEDLVLRVGAGVFYDLGVGSSANLAGTFPNLNAKVTPNLSVPIADPTPFLASLSVLPPYPDGIIAIVPNLKLPRSYQWNVALEKSFKDRQAISVTYVGQLGRDLLRQSAFFQPNANFVGEFLLTKNDAESNYNALQVQYRRPLLARLQALLNYTWSHSLDNASDDVIAGLPDTVISAASDRGNSTFDVRQSFSGALTYAVPAAAKSGFVSILTRNWSIDSVIVARSGFPFNANLFSTSPDPEGDVTSRPDLVPGEPFWVADSTAPGRKILNINAFSIPSTIRQGTEGRNDIPGFGLTEIDLSVARTFPIGERIRLQFRADAFNVFNHPNFANPDGDIEFGPLDLQSNLMLNQILGGLNPLFQEGGPRSLQLSLRLYF